MNNAVDIQSKPYQAAQPEAPRSCSQWACFALQMVLDVVLCFFKSIPLWVEVLMEFVRPPPPKSISGQTALVTGGANGIGKAIATELAKEGCNVVIVDVDETNGQQTASELKRFNVRTAAYKFDVADYEQVRELYRQVDRDFGPVDILVNNAGILPFLLQNEKNPSQIKRMMDVNVLSGFWTVEQFLPSMVRRRQGHIVSIASAASYTPVGFMKTYVTSKYAVRGFMEALDEELFLTGQAELIKTTTVFPFVINTRQQIMDKVNRLPGGQMPKISPEETGKTVLKAIKMNKRKVVVPEGIKAWQLSFYEHIPIKIRRMMDLTFMKGRALVLD